MYSILIFRTGGIGDVILSSVSLNIIHKTVPDAKVTWAGRRPCNELIKSFFPDVDLFDLDTSKSNLSLFSELKSRLQKPDLIIDLQKSPRTILLSILLKIFCGNPFYVTWNKTGWQRTIRVVQTHLSRRNQTPLNFKLSTRVSDMSACVTKGLRKLRINIPRETIDQAPEFIHYHKKENKIAICLGSLYPLKELPIQKTIELIRRINLRSPESEFCLIGDRNKKVDAQNLIHSFPNLNWDNRCGETTLSEAGNLLSKCRFAVVNDSALAHLSEAVGTPVWMFFGPTHPGFGYRPHLSKSRTFSFQIACRPCHKSGNTKCRYGDELCRTQADINGIESFMENI